MPQSEAVVALRDDRWHITGLESLAKALESMDIGPGAGGLAADRNRIVATLRTYLLPRFEDPHGPLVVVFAGPTGSGKSTLLNSLVGRDMSETGSLRPTTSEPVIVASEANAPRFETLTGAECEVVIGSAPILGVMALVDTPDIDSTSLDHRRKAEALVDRADVVVFVTSALRYADDVAWQVLRRAVSRGADVIHVLNRATSGKSGAVSDFRSLLRNEGLDDPLVTIPEHHIPTGGQQIPSLAIRSLRRRLAAIAAGRDNAARSTRDQVLAVALRDTQDLLAKVAGLGLELDAMSAELSLDLAHRAAGLDLTRVLSLDGITTPPPGRTARRRWRRELGLDGRGIPVLERRLVADITAVIHGDLRSWVEDERERLRGGVVERLTFAITPLITASLAGWVSFVSELAAGGDPGVLDRARTDLRERVGVVYEHFCSHVIEMIRARLGELEATDARAALVGLVSPTSLVDA